MKPKLSQKLKSNLTNFAIGLIWLAALISIFQQAYAADWTGFGDFTEPDGNFVRGKTLWDWMELLIIPIFLTVGLYLLNRSDQETERQIARDRQYEATLQAYLDHMAMLMLEEDLLKGENEQAKDIARIRTLTVLRGLDGTRKGFVVKFLHEAGLLRKEKAIVNLNGADLSYADLRYAKLQGANLANANLSFALLNRADLRSASFYSAHMRGADLTEVNSPNDIFDLLDWSLGPSDGTGLMLAYLEGANLQASHLKYANLMGAHLDDADLHGSDLTGADLTSASLTHANLRSANLTDVSISKKELKEAYVDKRTIMPVVNRDNTQLAK
jgi:uncharacterized protein YjbI with pentapeptide repeats